MKQIPLLYENHACMVLNKPAGLAVQGGEGVGVSLDSILTQSCKNRPLLVHRLDKDTSGLILVAKEKEAAAVFSALFNRTSGADRKKKNENLSIIKRYLAVAAGIPNPPKGIIRLDLNIRGQLKKSETIYRVLSASNSPEPSGKARQNRFSPIPGKKETAFSLLELELGSGRMHQIRRHLNLIHHPILGDDKYGDFSLNKQFRKTMGLKRLLLHASRLIIPPIPALLPEGLDISVPPPEYFCSFFSGFQFVHFNSLIDGLNREAYSDINGCYNESKNYISF